MSTKTIEVRSNWIVNGKTVKAIETYPAKFLAYATNMTKAAGSVKDPDDYDAALRTLKYQNQLMLVFEDGSKAKPDYVTAMTIPWPLPIAIDNALAASGSSPKGMIISNGDGITTPVHISLGTPIVGSGGGEDKAITELEFMAKTYGDMEKVMGAANDFMRVIAMVKHIAKPVTGGLIALPSWAIDQITYEDGMLIFNDVLPVFFDEDEPSLNE